MAGPAVRGWSEAHLTFAAIGTRDVEALPVFAEVDVFCALIDICGRSE